MGLGDRLLVGDDQSLLQSRLKRWAENTRRSFPIKASATWDPPNVANGGMISTTVTATGATVGQPVTVGFSVAVPAGAMLQGNVTALDTVTVTLLNNSGGALDFGSGTLRVDVWP